MDKEIIIEEYSIDWARQFEQEKRKLSEILGDRVKSIEHIGSTAVEGLGSKPVIDIAAGVNNLETINKFIEPLKQIEYQFVYHKEFPERRFFRKGQWRAGTHHLHFYEFEGEHWNNQLLFRDYLRKNPDDARKYHDLKVYLAEKYRFDRVAYTENKASFIQNILQKARPSEI
ncbi:GrpB family protein [Metabacillus indicus]|uniref:GrpB family protein n=1 Tax=Metabacillus indicus TaxID=246786 RepID=UPI003CF6D5B9